jgi:Arc/MetJ family transcription regulator
LVVDKLVEELVQLSSMDFRIGVEQQMDLAENYIPEKVLQGYRKIVVRALVGCMMVVQVSVGCRLVQQVLEHYMLERKVLEVDSLERQAVGEHMKEPQELVPVPLLLLQGVVYRSLLPEL